MPEGMLAQAAQNAAQVPLPGQQNQPAPGGEVAPPAGGPVPPPGAEATLPPVVSNNSAPDNAQAYQGEEIDIGSEPATPREEKEYQRVSEAMNKVLYQEDNIVDSIMQQLDPEDKIGSTTKATALLIQQLDEQIDMDEIVIPQITMDAVDAVTELAESRFNVQFSEQETQATLGATWEAVMGMFGVDEQDYQQLMQQNEPQIDAIKKSHKGFLAQGKAVSKPGGQRNG